MNYYLLFYFFAGMVNDFIVTLNWRFVARDKIFFASLTTFFTVLVYLLVLYNIISKLTPDEGFVAIVVYALGTACGTALGMKFKPGMQKQQDGKL